MIKSLKNPNFILIYLFFLLLIIFTVKNFTGPLLPIIAEELNLKLDAIGSLISASLIGLIVASIFSGNLIALFGFKRVISFGLLTSILGSIGIYFSGSFIMLLSSYFLVQFAAGMSFTSMVAVMGYFYSDRLASNIIKTQIGHTVAFIIAPLLVNIVLFLGSSWRNLFIFSIVPQILLIILIFFVPSSRKIKTKAA